MKKGLYLLSAVIISYSSLFAGENAFNSTLAKHLNAIQNRDFEQFVQTITTADTIDFILPNGAHMTTRADYLQAIEAWFAEDGWHFNYKIIRIAEGETLAHALLNIAYDEDDRNGKPYHIDHFLSLIFRYENGTWRMIHDQNTKIDSKS